MQHDYEITVADANTGVTMRAAINAALQALATMNEGPDEPTVTYPSMPWPDTTNNLLKIRNPANNAWVTIGKLDEIYLGLAALAAENEFMATQKLEGDALLLRFKDTGASGEEWAIRSDGGNFEIVKNTGTEGSPTWTVQTRIDVDALRVGDGTASDIRIIVNNNAATKPEIRYLNSGSKWQYSNDGSLFADMGSGGDAIKTPVRQTVLSSALDSYGRPNAISAGTGLAADIAATAIPLLIAFAAGHGENGAIDHVGTVDSDTSISSLTASKTNYLYAERNSETGAITLGKTVIPPQYGSVPTDYMSYSDGARIGNMDINPDYAFNGMLIAPTTTSAQIAELTAAYATVGKNWGSGKKRLVTQFIVYGSSDVGCLYTDRAFTVKLQGSDNGTDWTDLYTSGSLSDANGKIISVSAEDGIDISTPYQYHQVRVDPAAGFQYVVFAEVEFYGLAEGGHFFSVQEMVMYELGSSLTAKQIVFLGEAVTDGSGVTGVVNYALRGEYTGPWAECPGTNAAVSKNHNIGTTDLATGIDLRCMVAEYGYSAGDIVNGVVGNATTVVPVTFQLTRTAMSIYVVNTYYLTALRRDTGAAVALSPTYWRYRFKAKRRW